jgi:cold shock CspA family protein
MGRWRYSDAMPQATVKSYDSLTRAGTLVADDGVTEYAIDGEAMEGSMFRFLRPGQRVTFDCVEVDGATKVSDLRIGLA